MTMKMMILLSITLIEQLLNLGTANNGRMKQTTPIRPILQKKELKHIKFKLLVQGHTRAESVLQTRTCAPEHRLTRSFFSVLGFSGFLSCRDKKGREKEREGQRKSERWKYKDLWLSKSRAGNYCECVYIKGCKNLGNLGWWSASKLWILQ